MYRLVINIVIKQKHGIVDSAKDCKCDANF